MAVHPKIILGDPITGFGGSSLRQAYAIFNEHTHGRVMGSCYSYGLRVGMFLTATLPDGSSVFAPSSRIVEVGPDYFRVDTPLNVPAVNITVHGTMVVSNPHQVLNATAENCTVDILQQIVKVPPVGGEVPATLARATELKMLTGVINLHKSARDRVVTVISLEGGGTRTVQTPLDYIVYAPVLINPPTWMAIYQLTGILSFAGAGEANQEATVYLRKNLNTTIPGTLRVALNQLTTDSSYLYRYTQEGNITIGPGDILYVVVEMDNLLPVPEELYLHYTLSLLCLDEPL